MPLWGALVTSLLTCGALAAAACRPSTIWRQVLTARLATVFATLREMPAIRFRAAAPPGEEFPPGLESRLLVAQRIAVELHERLAALQRSGQLPERETCELILTDRGFDPVAPVIHEWTYEAMTYDLLGDSASLKDNVFVYDAETQGGAPWGWLRPEYEAAAGGRQQLGAPNGLALAPPHVASAVLHAVACRHL